MRDDDLYADHCRLIPLDDDAQAWLTASDHEFGKLGERFIRNWLELQRYSLCAEHYKPGLLAEVDLIMKPQDEESSYLFLEVKSRRRLSLDDPTSYESLIHPRQRARLVQLAGAFAERNDCAVELLLVFLAVERELETLKFSWRLMPLF